MTEQGDVDRGGPAGLRALLRGVALAAAGAGCRGVGEFLAGIERWVCTHLVDCQMRWVRRATTYDQRALRSMRPGWAAAEHLARLRAGPAQAQAWASRRQ